MTNGGNEGYETRSVNSSDIPYGEPYPIQLRSSKPKERTARSSGRKFWIWQAGLPKANAAHEGQYDPEYIDLLIFHPSLNDLLAHQVQTKPGRKDRQRDVWDLVLVRSRDGDHDSWATNEPAPEQRATSSGRKGSELPAGMSAKHNLDAMIQSTIYAYKYLTDTITLPFPADQPVATATWHRGVLETAEKIAVSANIAATASGKDLLAELKKALSKPAQAPQPARQPPKEEPTYDDFPADALGEEEGDDLPF